MKIAISGPPDSNKRNLFALLQANDWFKENSFSFVKNKPQVHLEEHNPKSQFLIYNDVLKNLVNNGENSCHLISVLDTLAHCFLETEENKMTAATLNSFIAMFDGHIHMYDYVFCIENSENKLFSKYKTVKDLFPGIKNIVYLSETKQNANYNKIISLTKKRLKDINDAKLQSSNMWISTFGQNDTAKPVEGS